MKFKIQIDDTLRKFTVNVFDDSNHLIHTCGWQGGKFEFEDKQYMVFGPYRHLDGDQFRVYELVPASEVA